MAFAPTSLNINSVHENIPREKMGVRQKLTAKLNLKNGEHPLLLSRVGHSEICSLPWKVIPRCS